MKVVPPTETERQKLITEARQIHFASPVLMPMLERRHRAAIKKITSAFRDGVNAHNAVAELYVIESILTELQGKMQILNQEKGE